MRYSNNFFTDDESIASWNQKVHRIMTAMPKFWGRSLLTISDYEKHQPKFVALIDETNGYMEPDYGPPDPPPQMRYETRARYTAILSEEELEEWILENLGKKFKIFKIEPIQYKTAIKVDIVK